jgi:hypothetical protein
MKEVPYWTSRGGMVPEHAPIDRTLADNPAEALKIPFCGGEIGRGDTRPVSDVPRDRNWLFVAANRRAVDAGLRIVEVLNIKNQTGT